ncbi:macro domain-containing protein RSc0334-like [Argiope bruennichi]|uniref:macro domain-containing protein RSc0334-like n=1 Tax=Argiope bruennichi TaxID=94029 RepID=UPI00249414E0|nr:macro domain-containing protein RSc0334-like [Argiope bruennichi]
MEFMEDRVKYMDMDLDKKRAIYLCKNSYTTLDDIPTWTEYSKNINRKQTSSDYRTDIRLNEKVSIFVGDITTLEIDAIVNSANTALIGSHPNRVDGSIHIAAGKSLLEECLTLDGCQTGEAKFTGGYKLPARYVIHTAGPNGEHPDLLKKCYYNSLNLAKRKGWKTIAFPCISTGFYLYPREKAAHIALKICREWLEKNPNVMDRIIFCLFRNADVGIYESLMQEYFPLFH